MGVKVILTGQEPREIHSQLKLLAGDNTPSVPSAQADAVNKQYVDGEIASAKTYTDNKFGTLGSAAMKDVPDSGDAGSGEVVLGNDSRLTDSRTPTAHAVDANTYGLGASGVYGHVKLSDAIDSTDDTANGIAATPKAVKAAITSANTYTDNKVGTLGTAAAKDVPTSGNASDTQVVLGSDTRLTNAGEGQIYGTCSTAAATAAKTVVFNNYEATTGGIIAIKFENSVPANATLNINDKGAFPIWYQGVAITANVIQTNDIGMFMYDGSHYILLAIDRLAGLPNADIVQY